MPPLTPPEEAVCASDFPSDASVGGQAMQRDAIHGKLTINQIKVTLQLNITIWLPTNPPKTTVDHENGHRRISEYYYRNADMVTRRIAEGYMGKVVAQRAGSAQGCQRGSRAGGGGDHQRVQ
jgi:hypothetical protein